MDFFISPCSSIRFVSRILNLYCSVHTHSGSLCLVKEMAFHNYKILLCIIVFLYLKSALPGSDLVIQAFFSLLFASIFFNLAMPFYLKDFLHALYSWILLLKIHPLSLQATFCNWSVHAAFNVIVDAIGFIFTISPVVLFSSCLLSFSLFTFSCLLFYCFVVIFMIPSYLRSCFFLFIILYVADS